MFTRRQVQNYAESRRIKLLISSQYYAQANGQVEAVNKVIINLISILARSHITIGSESTNAFSTKEIQITNPRLLESNV